MISALAWVPRGAPRNKPRPGELTEEESMVMERVKDRWDACDMDTFDEQQDMVEEEEDEEAEVERARKFAQIVKGEDQKIEVVDAMAELNMDAYDDEDGEERLTAARIFGAGRPGNMVFRSNEEDPYLRNAKVEDEIDSDEDDFDVRETDLMLLAARNEDDVSHLEAWIFEEEGEDGENGNLYVHHDIMLPSFPLSIAWTDWMPGTNGTVRGNLVAVSTFEPAIEIWNLDMIDAVEPVGVLGGIDMPLDKNELVDTMNGSSRISDTKSNKKKKKKKGRQGGHSQPSFRRDSHEDAVMALSWNPFHRHLLASGSADNTAKIWDMQSLGCLNTLRHHVGKVQSIAWDPECGTSLLTGSFDKTAAVVDTRDAQNPASVWKLGSDVEHCAWDVNNVQCFAVSTEDGMVTYCDSRKGKKNKPLWQLSAHSKPVCSLSFCKGCPNLLATASIDKTVKFWDISDDKPVLISSSQPKEGALFSAAFCKDQPFLFAAGGEKGSVKVWDVRVDNMLEKWINDQIQ